MSDKKFYFSADNTGRIHGWIRDKKEVYVRIQKDGQTYDYPINNIGDWEFFPLQMGSGTYTLSLGRKIMGKMVNFFFTKEIHVSLSDIDNCFLYPNKMVNYSEEGATYKQARKILELTHGNKEYAISLFQKFIKNSFIYDYIRAKTVSKTYIPNIDQVFLLKKGICYDFACLFTALCRSIGIKCKLVFGYADGEYHAWTEYFFNDRWVSYDPTKDVLKKEYLVYKGVKYF